MKPLQIYDHWNTVGDLHPMTLGTWWGSSQQARQTFARMAKCCFMEHKEKFDVVL